MKHVAVFAAFALIVVVFFWDVIAGHDWLMDGNPYLYDPWRSFAPAQLHSKNTLEADSFIQYYPISFYFTESLESRHFPLWNPYIFAGMPFFADPQSRVAYPITLLLLPAGARRAMGYDVAIHIFIALTGMYLFLNSLRLGMRPAVLGAIAYGFSSFFYVRYGHPTLVGSAAWMPFFFLGLETALRRERLGILILTVSMALSYLAGFPQVFLFGVLALVCYAFYLAVDRPARERPAALLKTARIVGISGALSMLLVSVQMLPFIEFYRNSVGLYYDFGYIKAFLMIPPVLLLRTVFPAFFGQPTHGTDWSALTRGVIHPYDPEFAVYCGIGALLAALVTFFTVRESPRVRILWLFLLAAVAVAVEPHVARLGHFLLPVFRASRISRVAVIPCFALSTLAAIGFATIAGGENARVRRRVLIVAACLVGIALVVAVGFQISGRSIIAELAAKARAVPESVWANTHMFVRSDKVREWALGDTSQWLAYEHAALLRGLVAVLATSAVLVLLVLVPARRRGLRNVLAGLFVALVLLDIGLTAHTYRVSQKEGSVWETPGVKALRVAVGDTGRWRTKPFLPKIGDLMPFPPNTNLLFGVHSLQGSHTINTESTERLRAAYVKSKQAIGADERAVKTVGTGISWLANGLDDLMSVRYVVAERGERLYAASSILRSILDPKIVSTQIRLAELGGENRLALCQESGQRLRFKAVILPVERLCFSVGFDSKGAPTSDSVYFSLTLDASGERVVFSRGFDRLTDGDRWHEASLDLSSLKNRMADVTLSVTESRPGGIGFGGWSDLEFAAADCPMEPVEGGYAIYASGRERCLSFNLSARSSEVPIDFRFDGGGHTRRWFAFRPGEKSRRVRVDLGNYARGRIIATSDSSFAIAECREVPAEWGIDPDCQLVYDREMCIYENSRAVPKGICVDSDQIPMMSLGSGTSLGLSQIEDIYPAERGGCKITSYKPEEVLVEVDAAGTCYLIFQDTSYPGWKAYVDGRETGFVETDIGIRAIPLRAGSRQVRMVFHPSSLTLGGLLTIAGLGLMLAYAGLYRK